MAENESLDFPENFKHKYDFQTGILNLEICEPNIQKKKNCFLLLTVVIFYDSIYVYLEFLYMFLRVKI